MTESIGSETRKNLTLYGGATFVVLLLVYFGWIYPKKFVDATGSLLSQAIGELDFAGRIPMVDKEGKPLKRSSNPKFVNVWKERQRLLDSSWAKLDKVEKQDPGLAVTMEMRAYFYWIQEDYENARKWYRDALESDNTGRDLVHRVRLNLARIDLVENRHDDALQALSAVEKTDRSSAWHVLEARIHHSKGDHGARSKALSQGYVRAGQEEKSLRLVANAAFEMSDDIAISCLESLNNKSASDFYILARLKMEASDPDSAHNALGEAGKLDPKLCAQLIQQDAKIWGDDPVAQEMQKVGKETLDQRPSGPGR
jgi:tetratricopeptide (TPR) repeat protein